MSISLVVLRIEIATGSPLLNHIQYTAPKLLRSMPSRESVERHMQVTGTNKSEEENNNKERTDNKQSLDEIWKKHRGQRVIQDITIETLTDIDKKSIEALRSETDNQKMEEKTASTGGASNADATTLDSSEAMQENESALHSKLASSTKKKWGCPESASNSVDSTSSSLNEKDMVAGDSNGGSGGGSGGSYEKKIRSMFTSQVPFYSGNHCVDVTRGILHLYKEDQMTTLGEESERSEMLCMLSVPAAMTAHNLLQFIAPVSQDVEHIRIIRDNKPNQYMVLLKFRNQKTADEFYVNFNGVPYNSLEPEVCLLAFVSKVETVKESENACLPLAGHTELPTCPVCLERMDESVDGILTILCNHSFHGSCLGKWCDNSCPVCRYCQTPELVPDNQCFGCGSHEVHVENLWICLICGHIGCGRYVEGHAYNHYLETQHTYAMQLGNNRVWDYAGDNYVHRLIQNKADGKPVELGSNRIEHEEKLDSIQLEYTYLLTSQLEAQRRFFEERITHLEKESHLEHEELKEKIKQAVEERNQLEGKLVQLTKEKQTHEKKVGQLTAKLNKAMTELHDEKEINKCLRQNQQAWQQRLKDTEKKLQDLSDAKDKEVAELREQVRDLMFYLETQQRLQTVSEETRQEIQEGQIVVTTNTSTSNASASGAASAHGSSHRTRRKKSSR